jgi:hypothetical protein
MPANRVRRPRQRVGIDGLTENAYQFYASGDFFGGEIFAEGKTEEELLAFWNKHREAIMARYLTELRAKGTSWFGSRPDYFFKELSAPRLPMSMDLASNQLYDRRKVACDGLEADFFYLQRLGLLEDWELSPAAGREKN